MAELHDALKYLEPVDWNDLPQSEEDLGKFLSECFTAGELLCNSVPPPNGTPFDSSQPQYTTPNAAISSKDIHPSSARQAPPDQAHADLQKQWGRPMKYSRKENPLEVALYKMAGRDRFGAWFSRHNVFEGMGFAKFKKAMMRELPETLLTQGPPGAGAKRGLSAERRVERMDMKGIGRLEVYQLSGQMPSPVSPRDFLTLVLTTDDALSEKSAAEVEPGNRHVPRHFMVLSKALNHSDAPPRSGFVRGSYQSVELIREIPLHASNISEGDLDPELNPVEWIMVTRSDPAGGIPRFLVDRGTPEAMLSDVRKFLDWACGQDEIPDPDDGMDEQQTESEQKVDEGVAEANGKATTEMLEQPLREAAAPVVIPETQTKEPGIVTNLSHTLEAGVEAYAPESVSISVHRQLHSEPNAPGDMMDSSSDSSSVDSFLSAEELRRLSTAPEEQPRESTENLSVASGASSSELSNKKNLTPHEKEVLRIVQQREKLDQKLSKKRLEHENKLKQSAEKEESEQNKNRERIEREMKKTEDRHRKEIEKLEARKEKEAKKAEERRRKKSDQNKLSIVARERDEFRSQADLLRKENELLTDQVETLQRENTALATRLGKLGGQDALKSVQDEVSGRSRSGTRTSKNTDSASLNSKGSGEKKGT